MNRFIQLLVCCVLFATGNQLLAQNVSTGTDNAGNALGIPVIDPNWTITAGPYGAVPAYTLTPNGAWEATPVAGSNAQWINATGTDGGNLAGNYTFERAFTISSSSTSFTTNFAVTSDDATLSLELVTPSGGVIPLTIPPAPSYMLSAPIVHTQLLPQAGTWRIRAVVWFVDEIGAFLFSGDINTSCDEIPCTCDLLQPAIGYAVNGCNVSLTSTGTIPPCMQLDSLSYVWLVNNVPVGLGTTFNYTFPGNGGYVVCLRVRGIMPDGKECKKKVCQDVVITDCDSCDCKDLIPSFSIFKDDCQATLTSTSTVPACLDSVQYVWEINGVNVALGPTLTYTFPGNGAYVVCLKVKGIMPDGSLCKQKVCNDVIIKDCPGCNCNDLQPSMKVTIDKCAGNFFAGGIVPACMQGLLTYNWYVDGTHVGAGSPFYYPFPGNGVYNVCLIASYVMADGTKCEKQVCQEVTITNCGDCKCKELLPEISYTTENCTGHFTAGGNLPACMNIAYNWSVDGTPAGSGATFNYTFPNTGTYTICLTTIGSMAGVACIKDTCYSVYVECGPCNCYDLHPSFQWAIDQCDGSFTNTSIVPGCLQNVTYEWSVDGISAGTGTTLNHSFNGVGSYNVCLKVTGTMPGPDSLPCVNEVCNTIFITECDTTCNCQDVTAAFSVAAINNCSRLFDGSLSQVPACMENVVYHWYVNSAPVGTGTTYTFTTSTNGVYNVCLMITGTASGNYCEKLVCQTVNVKSCVPPIGQPVDPPQGMQPAAGGVERSVILYPNPASTELTIVFEPQTAGEAVIKLKTADGKEFLRETRAVTAAPQHIRLQLPIGLADGMIFVELTIGNEIILRKVSVVRE